METGKEQKLTLSIVAPMYNEVENISEFYSRVKKVLDAICDRYEIICINDGSTDTTLDELLKLHKKDPNVKIINFSRNFGKQAALTAGIDFSTGEAVIPIDADLQDPPEIIPQLIEKWRDGYDIVYATRTLREGEGWFKRGISFVFYRVVNRLINIKIPKDTGDFRLINRPAVESLKELRESNRLMQVLFQWIGYRQTAIFYTRHKRNAGKPKQSYWELWNVALGGITSFSQIPLQFATYFGLVTIFFTLIYTLFLFINALFYAHSASWHSSLLALILFFGGVQLFTIGIIGGYIGRIYNEVKKRPLYIARELIGFGQSLEQDSTGARFKY
jgi:glycosyltransferase involved in cell wall biosynthesis